MKLTGFTLEFNEQELSMLKALVEQDPNTFGGLLEMYNNQNNPNIEYGCGKDRFYVTADYESLKPKSRYFDDYVSAYEYMVECNKEFRDLELDRPYYLKDTVLHYRYADQF